MLKTIVKKGSYQDSVVLMLLTNKLSSLDGVSKVSIMMATPANKDIFKASGLETPELLSAGPNDMAIVVDTEDEAIMDSILAETDTFIKNQSAPQSSGGGEEIVDSWDKALGKLPDANLAVISIPGIYAAAEADRALDEGLSIFMFSDNVTVEDEAALKQKAHERGLLVMGPDCGTGIIQGVPIAFTNHVAPGRIGIVGASGTGIQELTTIIDRLGEGVTNAIGTGGRDLSLKIGGITMLDAIDALEEDPETDVIIVISKPPAKEIRDRVVERLKCFSKPVVSLFLGEKPEIHELGFYHAYTLDEAARIAVALVRGEDIVAGNSTLTLEATFKPEDKKSIKGYYSGGTLAAEAAMLIKDTLSLETALSKEEGFMLNTENHIVIDLGDDVYTQGKPHPMIDPAKRIECMRDAADDATTGVILFDIVLGYGSHENMAGALLPAIEELKEKAAAAGRPLYFVTTICGTYQDIQNYELQKQMMRDAGVIVCESNKKAVEVAIELIGYTYGEKNKVVLNSRKSKPKDCVVSESVRDLIGGSPRIVNIGLKSFAEVAADFSCEVVQYNWTPPAGGDLDMIRALSYLRNYRFNQEESK